MNLTFFTPDEAARLEAARRGLRNPWTVAYCVWENQYAKSGGIGAVARDLPPAFASAGVRTVVISPWHSRLKTAVPESDFEQAGITVRGTVRVLLGSAEVAVRILEQRTGTVLRLYLDSPGHFTADGAAEGKDPYIYSHDPCATLDDCSLVRDSMLACVAVPRVLAALGIRRDVVVHAQDWQFASTALATKLALLEGTLETAVVAVTSHNPYDHQLSPTMLSLLTGRTSPRYWTLDGEPVADSVYAHMLPLTDTSVSTVSRAFAKELTIDPLLSVHFTPHLQETYRKLGVIGIPNGRFGRAPAVDSTKAAKRRAMLDALRSFNDPRAFGRLNPPAGDSVPVFFMFGRFDPGQKGFDLLARAIAAVPEGMARFIMAPQVRDPQAFPGDQLFVADLERLARRRKGEVVIYPFQMDGEVYGRIMAGASFAVMPSLYEPFGAATEAYLAGTPVIARATGGLTDQVSDMSTGLLYRESTTLDIDLGAEWAAIEKSRDPAGRMAVPLYASMVAALAAALVRGAVIYSLCPEIYARWLANLPAKAAEFDWNRTAQQYLDWFSTASPRHVTA